MEILHNKYCKFLNKIRHGQYASQENSNIAEMELKNCLVNIIEIVQEKEKKENDQNELKRFINSNLTVIKVLRKEFSSHLILKKNTKI